MTDPIKKIPFGDAKTAEDLLADYTDGYEGLTEEECGGHGLDGQRCMRLSRALRDWRFDTLEEDGFSHEFADHISGPAGLDAFKKRISWIADNVTVRRHWLFFPVESYKRWILMEELAGYGPAAIAARDAVAKVAKESVDYDDNYALGVKAFLALESIGPAKTHVPLLARMLEEEKYTAGEDGCSAIRMLGRLRAAESLPALAHAMELVDRHSCRDDLAASLANLGKDAAPALVDAITGYKSDDDVRKTAIAALSKMGPDSHDEIRKYSDALAAPLVAELIGKADESPTKSATGAVLKIIGRPAMPALMASFDQSAWESRDEYGCAKIVIGGRKYAVGGPYLFLDVCQDILAAMPETSLHTMIDLVNGGDDYKRKMAYLVLEKMGGNAAPAVPTLIARIRGEQTEFYLMSNVMAAIGEPAVPALCEKLRSENEIGRERALGILDRMGPKAVSAVPDVAQFLKDPSAEMRARAASTLGSISIGAPHAIMSLVHSLSDQDQRVRLLAVLSLKMTAPGSSLEQVVVPALEHMQGDPKESEENRKAAKEALEKILKKMS